MKNRPSVRATAGGTIDDVRAVEPLTWSIVHAERVAFGKKIAVARIEIAGLGIVNVEAYRRDDASVWVAGESCRNKYTGQYQRAVALDEDFAAAIAEALVERFGSNA